MVGRTDARGIEDRHVRGRALHQPAAILQPEQIGRIGGQLADALLQHDRFLLAHPRCRADKSGSPRRTACRHARPPSPSAIRIDLLFKSSRMRSSRVFHEEMVNSTSRLSANTRSRKASTASLPCSVATLGDRLALERLQRRILDVVHHDAPPIAEARGILEIVAEGIAKRRIGIDFLLRFLVRIGEHPLPRRKAAKANGFSMVHSRVSGSGDVCGRAPLAICGAASRSVLRTASGMSSRSNSAMKVTGRPLSVSRKSSRSHWSCSSTPTWRVSAISIVPLAALLELVGIGRQLLARRVTAGQRLALEAHMLVERGRGRSPAHRHPSPRRSRPRSWRSPRPSPRGPSRPRPSRSGGTASAAR